MVQEIALTVAAEKLVGVMNRGTSTWAQGLVSEQDLDENDIYWLSVHAAIYVRRGNSANALR